MKQKELKELYTEELKKIWDDRMVKYCSKSTAYVVEHNGKLYGIDKPEIEKTFCYGAGVNGMATEEDMDRAEAMAELVRQSNKFFINENLEPLDYKIKILKDIKNDMGLKWDKGSHPRYMIATCASQSQRAEDCIINYYRIVDTFRESGNGGLCEDTAFVDKLIEGYEEVKQAFIKRLHTYLKRYGLSKVHSWSYISD